MIEEVYIDRSVLETSLVEWILNHAEGVRVQTVAGREEAEERAGGKGALIPGFKKRLFVTRETGRFLRPCPGTPGMRCCNLHVLNPVVGCPYDCTYCFLQAYQTDPFTILYANLEDLEREVRALKARHPDGLLRISTGELADSLALGSWVGMVDFLVRLFAGMEGVLLELKTKSTAIRSLMELDHRGHTVVSWSLNTEEATHLEERGAPSMQARLRAAGKVVGAGYPVAFHFDPLIRSQGWEAAYAEGVKDLFEAVPAEAIRWISLGGFRYTPLMKARIQNRFPHTRLFLDEFLPCPDGKYRYFSKHRIHLYRSMLSWIRERGPRVPVYLCMEADYVWRSVFGHLPEGSGLLEEIFDGPRDR
jgi:spore photoproduct lyase